MNIFRKLVESVTRGHTPTPEDITLIEKQRKVREAYEAQMRAEFKEEQKRKKIRELKQIIKDARVLELLNQSGFKYHEVEGGVEFSLPYGHRLFFHLSDYTPFVSINHYLAITQQVNEFLLKYSDWIEKGQLAFSVNAKLNKSLDYSRIVYNFPLTHNLVIVYESNQLATLQPTILAIVKDATDIFVQLANRMPKSLYAFALRK